MNRRLFLKRIFGAAAVAAVGPQVVEAVAKLAPAAPGINPAWVSATYEADFIIPSQEIIDSLVARTAWYWNDLALRNLREGLPTVAETLCVKSYV